MRPGYCFLFFLAVLLFTATASAHAYGIQPPLPKIPLTAFSRTYDGLNRVTSYTFGGNTIGYRYYANGALAKLIYPGGTENGVGHVEYTYNADGRLNQTIDKLDSTASPRTTTYNWNTDGRLQSISRPNGTTRSILYDTAGRPYQITESAGLTWAIGYWTSDDIKTVNLTPAIPANQLVGMPNAALTFDSANQLSTFNSQSMTHDLDGNMLTGPIPSTGATGNYTYDSRNRLTSAGGLTYTYNAEGNRIGIGGNETTSLVVDPNSALPKVLSRTKNGVTTRYVYGAGLQYEVSSAGAATYYHYDQTGNTAALTNQSGAIIDRIAYSPYGTIRYRQASFDTPFLFGGFFGVMTDANGLINMRARYYNPLTMRFINSDPAMDGMNWYAYAAGNPINFADPTGFGASRVLDAVQVGLTGLGFAPGIGIVADIVNSGVSFSRGDALGGGLSLAAAIPIIGDAAAAGRIVRSASQISHATKAAAPVATAAKVEAAAANTAPNLNNTVNAVEDFLGGQGKIIKNADGDTILMRGDKKIRFDIKDPHGDKPHFHLEQQTPSGKWKDAGPEHRYYFKEDGQ